MIRFLSIKHLAVIDGLELEFEPGLTVLTGETGAGKSIVIGAVGLLLGGRASPDLVRTGERQAVLQAVFETFDGKETIVRREISAHGRSRAFIDDNLATSTALKTLGTSLVDLHGQHEHQLLLDPKTHLDFVDEYGGFQPGRRAVAEAFAHLQAVRAELQRCTVDQRDTANRMEILRFQLGEINAAALEAGEDDTLRALRQRLANADTLHRLCTEGHVALYEGDRAVLPELSAIWRRVEELVALDPHFAPHLEARERIKTELEDLAFALRSYASGIDAPPERLQQVEDRLAVLERLKKKYGQGSLTRVLSKQHELEVELQELEALSTQSAALGPALENAQQAYLAKAATISRDRQHVAPTLTSKLEQLLTELAMDRARCEIRFHGDGSAHSQWTDRGIDDVELYLSANPGEELRPLARIASGGELSRVMLALKTLASTDAPGKTLIFDEVDAGIGGRVADVVGQRLRNLSDTFQVVCVTHLPQIAAYGSTHYHVVKTVHHRRTLTSATRLEGEARVEAIARLMTGSDPSDHARSSARELLARTGEQTTKMRHAEPHRKRTRSG